MSDAKTGKRRILTATQWQALLGRFERGGDNVTAFCRRHGVSPSSFHRCRRKLGPAPAEASNPAAAAFIDAGGLSGQTAPAGATWDIELALGDEVILRLRRSR